MLGLLIIVLFLALVVWGRLVAEKKGVEEQQLPMVLREQELQDHARDEVLDRFSELVHDEFERTRENALWKFRTSLAEVFDSPDRDAETLADRAFKDLGKEAFMMSFRFDIDHKELLDKWRPVFGTYLSTEVNFLDHVLHMQFGRLQDSLVEEAREEIRPLLPRIRAHNKRPLSIFYNL